MIDVATTILAPTHQTLALVLAYERRLLEQMLFRQTEVLMLLSAGEHRFVARALDELAEIEKEFGAAEIVRAATVEELTANRSHREPTIADAIASAPAAVVGTLRALETDLRRLSRDISERRRQALELATLGAESTRRALAGVSATGYRSDGSAVSGF